MKIGHLKIENNTHIIWLLWRVLPNN